MSKGEIVSTEVLMKKCKILHCSVGDIVDFVETLEKMEVKESGFVIKKIEHGGIAYWQHKIQVHTEVQDK